MIDVINSRTKVKFVKEIILEIISIIESNFTSFFEVGNLIFK